MALSYCKRASTPSSETTQNRSVLGWVRPLVVFHFGIELLNLSLAELGALI